MSPTANHSDLIWKAVVSGVAVRVEIPPEVFQKCFRIAGAPSRLVVKQHNGPVSIPVGAVQPHIAVALGCFTRFMEYLQCGLIRVEDVPFQQFFVQQIIDRGQQMLRRPQQPVGHGLP